MKKYLSFIVALMVTLFAVSSFAFTPPSKPDNGWYVLDQAGKLSSDQVSQLNHKIENLNKTTKNEYAVLVVSSLDGDSIEDAAQATFRAWGVGKKGLNNGVMLIVSVGDHKMRIQTGKGAEGDLPDLLCKDILDQQAKPRFKRGQFYEGIDATIDAMAAHMESRSSTPTNSGKTDNAPAVSNSSGSGSGGCSIVGVAVSGFAVVAFLGLLAAFLVVRFFVRKARQAANALKQALEDDNEVTLPRIQAPVVTRATVPLPVVPVSLPVPVVRPVVTPAVPKPAVHPAPVTTAPRPSHTGAVVAAAAVGLGAGAAALALAEARRREEEEEATRARKRREQERKDEEERARKRRQEEDDDRARRSSSSDSGSSSWDSGGSWGGGGFGGGDSGGGGASSDW